jgi:hypothetical protein
MASRPAPRHAATPLHFERSARSDLRWWGMLLVGLVFAYAGATIDPARNCGSDGECAPWLVPLAFVGGVVFALGGASQLIVNARRGSYVDIVAGELVWWEGRVADGRASDQGRLPLAQIARIVLVSDSDSDEIFLYDAAGALLPIPSGEVIPWPFADWAARLAEHVPGLIIEERRR